MVKLTGPGLGQDAGGKLAGALIFSHSAKGAYLKTYAKPKQPRTDPQMAVRAMMRFLTSQWAALTPSHQITWLPLADQLRLSAYHAYLKYNQERWSHFLGPSKEYPAAEIIPPLSPGGWSATAMYLETRLQIPSRVALGGWGHITYRSTPALYTPSLSTVKIVHAMNPVAPSIFKDTPLPPGTYRYMRNHFSTDGTITPNTEYRTVTIP